MGWIVFADCRRMQIGVETKSRFMNFPKKKKMGGKKVMDRRKLASYLLLGGQKAGYKLGVEQWVLLSCFFVFFGMRRWYESTHRKGKLYQKGI